ncbi:MAG: cupin domain-containing protein [Sulfitobacter sp.]
MKFVKFSDHDVAKVQKDLGDTIVSGTPVQHSQLKFSGANDSFKSGIWESTAGVFTADFDGIIEFCHILEGGASIRTSDGETFSVSAGDAFVMDNGLKTEWTVDEYVKKHFVICSA